MSKAMAFTGWWENKPDTWDGRYGEDASKLWDAARVGMIPEDQAVRIPDVGKWPQIAVGCRLAFDCVHSDGGHTFVLAGDTPYIPRPVPVWAPKESELVFFLDTESIYKVERINSDGRYILVGGNVAELHELKEGDASKIGKPWGEI